MNTDLQPEVRLSWSVASASMRGRLRHDPLMLLSLAIIVIVVVAVVAAPLLTGYADQGYGQPNLLDKLLPPSNLHPFGTDHLGRDLFARVLFGGRVSLLIALLVIGLSIAVGVPLGALAGYYGGWLDELIMRIADVFLAFPPLLLAIVIAAALGPGLLYTAIAIALSWWPWYTRITRAQVLSLRHRPFIQAARAIGLPRPTIIVRHLLPYTFSSLLVQATLDIGAAILIAAALSFLGLGVPPPAPDWGQMVSAGRVYFPDYWWYVTFPGLAIFLTTMAFNIFGDSLRDS